jgi:hypothetical protein
MGRGGVREVAGDQFIGTHRLNHRLL